MSVFFASLNCTKPFLWLDTMFVGILNPIFMNFPSNPPDKELTPPPYIAVNSLTFGAG